MDISAELLAQAGRWGELKRWQRRELAQELRGLGLSYRQIGAIIPVGKASLSAWCRDVELDAEQRLRLRALRPADEARIEVGRRRREQTRERHEAIRDRARQEAGNFILDPLWVAGVVAYWAEGSKTTRRITFSNSDPSLIRLFVGWAGQYLGATTDRLGATLHLHTGQDQKERIAFWSEITGVPPDRFGKTFIKPEGSGHRKKDLYNGTASGSVPLMV